MSYAPLTSRRCILYIYSTNIRTEYFKHAAHSPFFPLQNVVYFIILHCLVPVLFAFYIQGVLKFKCKIHAPKGLIFFLLTGEGSVTSYLRNCRRAGFDISFAHHRQCTFITRLKFSQLSLRRLKNF